ncbi:MAG: DUF5678 domain-containing protein [Blastocatellia bacterium]|nr:DUF5678 domain-containing protein [Blastocatellia bacterium]
MSNDLLNQLKEQSEFLTPEQKQELAKFLTEQVEPHQRTKTISPTTISSKTSFPQAPGSNDAGDSGADPNAVALKREQHLAWLKAHREEYAGQYVALDGDQLVGCGLTIREAHDQARQLGIERPFLVHISSVNDAPFGGW